MNPQIKPLINQLQFNFAYLLDLVSDVEPDSMTHTPCKGLENHPAFTIGHLITAYAMITKKLGGEYTISDKWDRLFKRNGPGDPRYPSKEIELYPTKKELLKKLKEQHEILLTLLKEISNEKLNENVQWRFNKYFPKIHDMLYFMLNTHYSMHISQLAAWRRAVNLPSSLARL